MGRALVPCIINVESTRTALRNWLPTESGFKKGGEKSIMIDMDTTCGNRWQHQNWLDVFAFFCFRSICVLFPCCRRKMLLTRTWGDDPIVMRLLHFIKGDWQISWWMMNIENSLRIGVVETIFVLNRLEACWSHKISCFATLSWSPCSLPSWELTYSIPSRGTFEDDLTFPVVGYVSFLEGKQLKCFALKVWRMR